MQYFKNISYCIIHYTKLNTADTDESVALQVFGHKQQTFNMTVALNGKQIDKVL